MWMSGCIEDNPPPTPHTTGRPGLLCTLIGHVFEREVLADDGSVRRRLLLTSTGQACLRPGCRTVRPRRPLT